MNFLMKSTRTIAGLLLASCLWGLSGCCVTDKNGAAQSEKRYFTFGVWNFVLTDSATLRQTVDKVYPLGFNSIRLHIPWFQVEKAPGVYDFTLFDEQLRYLIEEKNLQVMLTIDFTRRVERGASGEPVMTDGVIGLDECQYDDQGKLCSGGAFFDKAMVSFASESALAKASKFYAAVLQQYLPRYRENIFLFSPVFSQYAESEYWCAGNYDYSVSARQAFRKFVKEKYPDLDELNRLCGTAFVSYDALEPPVTYDGNLGLLWYQYRHHALKQFTDALISVHKRIAPGMGCALQLGSVFDASSPLRGSLGFVALAENADALWVDDAPRYDHNWSMDYLESNLPGKQIANEIDGYYQIVQGNGELDDYRRQGIESYRHHADIITVANWTPSAELDEHGHIFREIADSCLVPSFRPLSLENGPVMEVSLYELFRSRSAEPYIKEYNRLTQNGRQCARIVVVDDLTGRKLE